jgi:hypothetical protein
MGALEKIVTAERPDPAQLDASKRAVRDGRRRVANTFRRTAGSLLPTQKQFYWQKFATPAGIRYRVAVALTLPNPVFEKLFEQYNVATEEMGVGVVTFFPALGWRYELEDGAIVTNLKPDSPMRLVGIAPGDIITAVDDIPIKDAIGFQKTVQVRYQIACKEGADMVWKAKRGDGPIVDMRARIPAGCGKVAPPRPYRPGPGPGYTPPKTPTKGGRNIWEENIRE